MRHRQIGQWLVAADVKRPYNQAPIPAQRFGNACINGRLLILAWRFRPLQEEKFRPQESDAVAAEFDNLFRIGRAANVAGNLDSVVIGRHGRLFCRGQLFLPGFLFLFLLLPDRASFRLIRVQTQDAFCPVKHDRRAVREIQSPHFNARNGR